MGTDVFYDMFSGMSDAEIVEQLIPMVKGFYTFTIVVSVLMLIIAGVTAHKKGRSVVGCLILTMFLGLIGLIIVACMRPKKTAPASRTTSQPSGGGSATFGRSSGSSSSSTARPSGSGSSSTPTPTFGRGSSGSSSGSSSSTGRSSSNGFTSAIGSSGSSSGKKGFGIKMCPHCGSAVSTKHCAMCGKDNNLF